MTSFYGRGFSLSSFSGLTFDKVYPNRKAMEDAAPTDGVFVGRYVLVEYGQEDYDNNYQTDQEKYKKNYDSTVWRKGQSGIYEDIAELNAVVPSISMVLTDPSSTPSFDEESTNINYILNMPNTQHYILNQTIEPAFSDPTTAIIPETAVSDCLKVLENNEQDSDGNITKYNKEVTVNLPSVERAMAQIGNVLYGEPVNKRRDTTCGWSVKTSNYNLNSAVGIINTLHNLFGKNLDETKMQEMTEMPNEITTESQYQLYKDKILYYYKDNNNPSFYIVTKQPNEIKDLTFYCINKTRKSNIDSELQQYFIYTIENEIDYATSFSKEDENGNECVFYRTDENDKPLAIWPTKDFPYSNNIFIGVATSFKYDLINLESTLLESILEYLKQTGKINGADASTYQAIANNLKEALPDLVTINKEGNNIISKLDTGINAANGWIKQLNENTTGWLNYQEENVFLHPMLINPKLNPGLGKLYRSICGGYLPDNKVTFSITSIELSSDKNKLIVYLNGHQDNSNFQYIGFLLEYQNNDISSLPVFGKTDPSKSTSTQSILTIDLSDLNYYWKNLKRNFSTPQDEIEYYLGEEANNKAPYQCQFFNTVSDYSKFITVNDNSCLIYGIEGETELPLEDRWISFQTIQKPTITTEETIIINGGTSFTN